MKPTISELEAIIDKEGESNVTILPDGEVLVKSFDKTIEYEKAKYEIKRLKVRHHALVAKVLKLEGVLNELGDHPLVLAQGGYSPADRCHRVINKLQAEIERLRAVIRHLLLSRDISWDKNGGHDFGESVKQAITALEGEL